MAASLPTSAKDMRECSVCLEDMLQKSPKLLECKHSFCTPCLSALAEAHTSTLGMKVSCPNCKHSTIIKSGTLSDLPDNFLLQELKTALEDQISCNYCFYCSVSHIEAFATSLCNTCCRFMCKNCSEKHRKRFAKHEIMLIMKEKQQERCQEHNQLVVNVCSACSPRRLLCDVCMMLDEPCHGDEQLIDYTTALSREVDDLRLTSDQCNVDDVLSKFEGFIKGELSDVQENVVFIKQGLDCLVKKITSQIKESVDYKALNLAANTVKACKIKALKLLKSDVRQLDSIYAVKEEITKALKSFSEKEKKTEAACKTCGSDPRVLQELVKIKQCLYVLQNRPKPVSCWPTKATVSKLRATKKGWVVFVCQDNPVIMEISPDGMKRQLQTQHVPHNRENVSIDIFDNNMYITSHNNLDINVYLYKCDLSTDFHKPFPSFSQLKPLNRFWGWSVADMCVCNANNIMLVRGSACLHRYDESSDTVMDLKCPFADVCIQLTSVKVDGHPRFIATYVNKKVIILHDNEGNTIQTISKYGSQFKQPRATTINAVGNILVADFETCKIVEITLKGEFVRDVLTKEDGLGHPVNVAYSRPYLWVADQTQDGKFQLKCFLL